MFQDIRRFVRKIPKGKVATYGQIAEAAGFPRASRQVAWALKDSPPDLPWQRVIGKATAKRGKILLRGANGVRQVQELTMEGVKVNGIFVDLQVFGHDFTKAVGKAPRRRAMLTESAKLPGSTACPPPIELRGPARRSQGRSPRRQKA